MPNDPLTGARVPDGSYAPDITQVADAVFDLSDNTIPYFTSTALRDTAYSSWVANGGAMRNGLHCMVGTTRYVYLSSAWVVDPTGYQTRMMLAHRTVDTGSFPNGAWTPFSAGTNWVEVDPWGMHGTGGNFTATLTGWYEIRAGIVFEANATGTRGLRLNPTGADIGAGAGLPVYLGIQRASAVTPESNGTAISGSAQGSFASGQTVALEAYQDTGSTATVNNVWISAVYLGPNT